MTGWAAQDKRAERERQRGSTRCAARACAGSRARALAELVQIAEQGSHWNHRVSIQVADTIDEVLAEAEL